MSLPDLRMALVELLWRLNGTGIKLIMGGGFGIFLRTERVRKLGLPTLLKSWPEARSTNDLDLFLRPELLIASENLKPLADALANLGYEVVPEAKKYQFIRTGSGAHKAATVKIDILTGPESRFRDTPTKVDARRVQPIPSVGIHAHPVNEALTLEEGLLPITLDKKQFSGVSSKAEVFLPNAFTFLMMKLYAFRDRLVDANKEYASYHALDLFMILATTTKDEWNTAVRLRSKYGDETCTIESCRIVSKFFLRSDDLGILRLMESPYYSNDLELTDFMSSIKELFVP